MNVLYISMMLFVICIFCTVSTGAYAGFLKGGGANFKISGILDIHAAKLHVTSSEAPSLC